MSVIEFLSFVMSLVVNYYDWYLFIGLFVGYIITKSDHRYWVSYGRISGLLNAMNFTAERGGIFSMSEELTGSTRSGFYLSWAFNMVLWLPVSIVRSTKEIARVLFDG